MTRARQASVNVDQGLTFQRRSIVILTGHQTGMTVRCSPTNGPAEGTGRHKQGVTQVHQADRFDDKSMVMTI